MKTKTTYHQKLLDPRWQKKRLKVLDRDNFTCQCCANTKKTLEIHHQKYGKEPWSIEDKYLTTYCSDCHEIIEVLIKNHKNLFFIKIEINERVDKKIFITAFCFDKVYNVHCVHLFLIDGYKIQSHSAISEKSLLLFYNKLQSLKDE